MIHGGKDVSGLFVFVWTRNDLLRLEHMHTSDSRARKKCDGHIQRREGMLAECRMQANSVLVLHIITCL